MKAKGNRFFAGAQGRMRKLGVISKELEYN
jgi:hypothetical protein